MKINLIQKIKQSLFLKIVLIFFAAYLVFTGAQTAIHRYVFRAKHFSQVQRNMVNYADHIIEELGTPPDTLLAKNIAQKLGVDIGITASELNWKSKSTMRSFNELDIPWFDEKNNVRAGFDRGFWVYVKKSDVEY